MGDDAISRLATVLSRAVVASLDDMARDENIPPLSWAFSRYEDALVIEGRPRRVTEIPNCERWAELLGLTEFAFEAQTGHRGWYSNDGLWWLEVIALLPEDDRPDAIAPDREFILSEADSL
jgi:hypothetical protein